MKMFTAEMARDLNKKKTESFVKESVEKTFSRIHEAASNMKSEVCILEGDDIPNDHTVRRILKSLENEGFVTQRMPHRDIPCWKVSW